MPRIVKTSPEHRGTVDTIHFGRGDYGRKANFREEAQEYFLEIVRLCTPDPLYWLRDRVWPKYMVALEQEVSRGSGEHYGRIIFDQTLVAVGLRNSEPPKSHAEGHSEASVPSEYYEAAKSLIEWSHRFNLRAQPTLTDDHEPCDFNRQNQSFMPKPWPIYAAEETLWGWYTATDREKMLQEDPPRWCTRAKSSRRAGSPEFLGPIQLMEQIYRTGPDGNLTNPPEIADQMEMVAWYVEREPEEMFRRRAREGFERWLNTHVKNTRGIAQANGLSKGPLKRRPEHFAWLALYQIKQLPVSAIAKSWCVSIDAVKDALERTSKLICLEKRPGLRGPARKKLGD